MEQNIIFHQLKIDLPTRTGGVLFEYTDIMYILYDKPYCMIYAVNGRKIPVKATVAYLMDKLPHIFFQCNKSSIINLCHLKEYSTAPEWKLKMADDALISLALRRINEFKQLKDSLYRITSLCPSCVTCVHPCETRTAFLAKQE